MKAKRKIRILQTVLILIGLGLILIGGRFLIAPEAGERGYGLNFAENGDYSFHYIKGVRDLFSGALIAALAVLGRRSELALTLGLGIMIPAADFLIVLNAPNANRAALWIHGITVITLLALAGWLVRLHQEKENA